MADQELAKKYKRRETNYYEDEFRSGYAFPVRGEMPEKELTTGSTLSGVQKQVESMDTERRNGQLRYALFAMSRPVDGVRRAHCLGGSYQQRASGNARQDFVLFQH